IACALAPPTPVNAQADPGWIGTRVVQRSSEFALRTGSEAVPRSVTEIYTYRVEGIDDDGCRLQLKAESNGPSGWIAPDLVIPFDRAIAFFTDRIEEKTRDAFARVMRAKLWRDKKEYDRALRDYDEALRIDPQSARAYIGRGSIWSDKHD